MKKFFYLTSGIIIYFFTLTDGQLFGFTGPAISLGVGTVGAYLTPLSAFGAAAGLIGAGVINKAISAYASNYIEADLQEDASPAPPPKKPRRRGRSLKQSSRNDLNIFNNQIDAYFETVSHLDTDDCGKRLVCEIKAAPEFNLSDEERLIAGLFLDTWGKADASRARSIYDSAAYLGYATKSKAACAARFFKCPVDRKTMLRDLADPKRMHF